MKRSLILILPLCTLAACNGPVGPDSIPDPQSSPVPFVVPMDPGAISCAQVSNPTALMVATEWVVGQARAAALSGRAEGVPAATAISQSVADYCRANSSSTVRAAARQIGF